MPAKGVWVDFKRLKDDRIGPSKQQHCGESSTDVYAQWQCPYCPEIVEARAEDAIDKKSDACKVHFWGEKPCPNRPVDDLRGKPKAPRGATRPRAVVTATVRDLPRVAARPRVTVTADVRDSSQEDAMRAEVELSKSVAESAIANEQLVRTRLAEMEQTAIESQRRISELENTVRQFDEASCDDDSRVAAAEARLQQLKEAETIAEDAMCLSQLRSVFRRVGVQWHDREQTQAMFLGQYREVLDHFAGRVSVSRAQMIEWLQSHPTGRRFWDALCVRCGFPRADFDPSIYEIEHVNNSAWGGADHPLNYMVLYARVNRSIEFRAGPSHLKMILLGRQLYGRVQKFARWCTTATAKRPRDAFAVECDGAVAISLLGGPQQSKLSGFKRPRA